MSNKFAQYVKDSKSELKKVVWPTRKQATNHTILVIGFSLAVAAFLGAIDYVLNLLLEMVIK
jgi:preprotein translocase subunit SecE